MLVRIHLFLTWLVNAFGIRNFEDRDKGLREERMTLWITHKALTFGVCRMYTGEKE